MKTAEFTVKEIKEMMSGMSSIYDVARVVDPRECRILEFGDDGSIKMREKCHGVWDSDHRCANCSSAAACKTGQIQKKSEHFRSHIFDIQSNPIRLMLDDGTGYDAVMELISVSSDEGVDKADLPNDREDEERYGKAAVYFAAHDSLTKVFNADAFYEYAREILSKRIDENWVMIATDIMSFHLINDLFGIEKGNDVLAYTAELLDHLAVESDGICGRLVSDRFGVFIPAAFYSEKKLEQIAYDLRSYADFGIYTLHIHFGVYEIADNSLPIHTICNRARTALRTIQHDARRLTAYYDREMYEQDRFDHRIVNSFEKMLKDGRYHVYLQPLVDEEGRAFGAEALVRCFTSDGRVIPPYKFIRTLERAGLIHELDRFVWEFAVKKLHSWKGTARDHLCISVNISAMDFYSMDVYEVLNGLTHKYGIDPMKLRLEITETAFMDSPETVNSVLAKLRNAGFIVEIDDFGSGYSSLGLLKDVEADILKLDMSFLTETKNKYKNDVILGSVIGMAGKLGMDVIAEGIETEDQLHLLSSMGCSRFQGYYFSKPVPLDVFESIY